MTKIIEILKCRIKYLDEAIKLYDKSHGDNVAELAKHLLLLKINFESIYKLSFEKFKIMYLLENVDETNIKSAIIDTIESIEISLHTNTIRHSSHEITNLISIWELEVNIDFQKYLKNLIRHY